MTDNKSKLAKILRTKSAKIFVCSLIVVILVSSAVIPSFADDQVSYQTIAPVEFLNFSGDVSAVAFPGPHSLALYHDGSAMRYYLNSSDYTEKNTRILYGSFGGQTNVPYIQIHLSCNYGLVYIDGVSYSGSNAASTITDTLSGVTTFSCLASQHSYNADVTYYYTWNILLGNFFNYDQVYQDGFSAGVNSSEAEDKWYQSGYNEGLSDGRASTDSANLGENLLGDTLSAPMDALNSFTLYESSSGFKVTLGLVVGGAISLTLFIAFLKIFAGG